jgi:hypothetical protein
VWGYPRDAAVWRDEASAVDRCPKPARERAGFCHSETHLEPADPAYCGQASGPRRPATARISTGEAILPLHPHTRAGEWPPVLLQTPTRDFATLPDRLRTHLRPPGFPFRTANDLGTERCPNCEPLARIPNSAQLTAQVGGHAIAAEVGAPVRQMEIVLGVCSFAPARSPRRRPTSCPGGRGGGKQLVVVAG